MADLYINYGVNYVEMTYDLMKEGKISERVKRGAHVVVKPNLVVAREAQGGATTHIEVIEGIVRYLQECCDVARITIAEGSWVGDSTRRAFAVCGYNDLAARLDVELVDTKKDKAVKAEAQGHQLSICETFVKADYFINVPVLKGHCQTDMTCCLKNLKGCIPDAEKRRFHQIGLHEPIAALNCALHADLHIVDSICGDLNFEEGGNPVQADRIMMGFDPVLVDSYGAGLIGYAPSCIDHLRIAAEWGVGRLFDECCEVVELGADKRPMHVAQHSHTVRDLAERYIDEDSACSACYAALVFALHKAGGHRLGKEHIRIGQGFRGKENLGGFGVGNCCSGCGSFVPGCPPTAVEVMEFLDHI